MVAWPTVWGACWGHEDIRACNTREREREIEGSQDTITIHAQPRAFKQNSNPLDACALLRALLLYDAVRGHAHTSTTWHVRVVSAMHEGLCGKSVCAAFHLQYAQNNMSVAHIMNKPASGISKENHADQPAASRSRLSPSQWRLKLCVHTVARVHTCRWADNLLRGTAAHVTVLSILF
jgi:hypothetical protein